MDLRRPLILAAAVGLATAGARSAQSPPRHGFASHAAVFSLETKQNVLVDPQVFVPDAAAGGAVGLQGIVHANGIRPALLTDDPATKLENAQGKPLGPTLGEWLDARGSYAGRRLADGREIVEATFTGLVPRGIYSLFENAATAQGVVSAPLDGTGRGNSFRADRAGRARAETIAPRALTAADAVLAVWHSDGRAHGRLPGEPGITAHDQLISRAP